MIKLLSILLVIASLVPAKAYDIPPAPTRYITDTSNIISLNTLGNINKQLEDNEKATSNQILVYIQPTLPSDAELNSYCTEVFHAWKVGQKNKDNGAIFFVFNQSHKMFIATGRGLEGALPDGTCTELLIQNVAPRFKQGDFDGGIQAGVDNIIKATKGEYKGNGTTVAQQQNQNINDPATTFIIFGVVAVIAICVVIFCVIAASGGNEYPDDPEPEEPTNDYIPSSREESSGIGTALAGAAVGAALASEVEEPRRRRERDEDDDDSSSSSSSSFDFGGGSDSSSDSGTFSGGGGDSGGGGGGADW